MHWQYNTTVVKCGYNYIEQLSLVDVRQFLLFSATCVLLSAILNISELPQESHLSNSNYNLELNANAIYKLET